MGSKVEEGVAPIAILWEYSDTLLDSSSWSASRETIVPGVRRGRLLGLRDISKGWFELSFDESNAATVMKSGELGRFVPATVVEVPGFLAVSLAISIVVL